MKPVPMPEEQALLSADEIAEAGWLRAKRSLIHQMIRQGELPSVRVGRRVFVPTAGLRRVLLLDGDEIAS